MSISPAFGTAIHSNAVKTIQILKVKIIRLIMICTTIAAPVPAFAANSECGLGYVEQIRFIKWEGNRRSLQITLDTNQIVQMPNANGRRSITIAEPPQEYPAVYHESWQTYVLLAMNAESSRLFVRLTTREEPYGACNTIWDNVDMRVCSSRDACAY